MGPREYQLWHVYGLGGGDPRLKVRFREWAEVPAWAEGPDLAEALRRARAEGWRVYDREPGDGGAHSILHLVRRRPA